MDYIFYVKSKNSLPNPRLQTFSTIFFFFSVTALFYLEDSRRERESERKSASTWERESPRESALAPPFICFFFHLGTMLCLNNKKLLQFYVLCLSL